MAHASDVRSSVAQPNIQDVFLNSARREKADVVIHLLDGRSLEARIKNFDRFAVIIEVDGHDEMVFKHAIATIATDRVAANYLPPHHS